MRAAFGAVRRRPGRSRRRPRAARAERAAGARSRGARQRGVPLPVQLGGADAAARATRSTCRSLRHASTSARLARLRGRARHRGSADDAVGPDARGVDVVRGRRASRPTRSIGAWPAGPARALGPDAPNGSTTTVARRLGHLAGRRTELMSCAGRSVAIVTGASRGIGKGCALELGCRRRDGLRHRPVGERVRPPAPRHDRRDRARDRRARRHGRSRSRCDHRDDAAVEALFDRVLAEHGRLDILVNNAFIVTNELTSGLPFWEVPTVELGRHDRRRHPLRLRRQRVRGAADGAGERRPHREHQRVGRGGVRVAASRTASASARSTASPPTPRSSSAPHGVSVVSLWPGFVRTERIDVGVDHRAAPRHASTSSTAESPRFTGRAVVALATDPDVVAVVRPGRLRRATSPTSTASATSTAASPPAPSATAPT